MLGGPRRLVVMVSELAEHQEDRTVRAKGPAAKAAFDDAGNPTPAAIGFARGKGVDVAALEVVEDANGSYVYAVIEEIGAPGARGAPRAVQPDDRADRVAEVDAVGERRRPLLTTRPWAARAVRCRTSSPSRSAV